MPDELEEWKSNWSPSAMLDAIAENAVTMYRRQLAGEMGERAGYLVNGEVAQELFAWAQEVDPDV